VGNFGGKRSHLFKRRVGGQILLELVVGGGGEEKALCKGDLVFGKIWVSWESTADSENGSRGKNILSNEVARLHKGSGR